MDSPTRQQRRSVVRHFDKIFKGRATAEEVHSALAFPPGARCCGCGSPPLTRVIILMELAEALKNPTVAALNARSGNDFNKWLVALRDSEGKPVPYFRVSVTYACKRCTPALEKLAAKAPSHCVVEINRGPGPEKLITSC